MKISVFGLGYVGCVTSACLADNGQEVIGVDVNEFKVRAIAGGRSPIIEKGLDKLIAKAVDSGSLRVTSRYDEAVDGSELSMVCVGTPSREDGEVNMEFVRRVTEKIGTVLRDKSSPHTLVVRSTMLPGAMEKEVIPRLVKASGKKLGVDLGVGYNPEFLREGSAVSDFLKPPITLIAATDTSTAERLRGVYDFVGAPFVVTSMQCAEMVKYINNAFHALKVCFANEVGTLCRVQGIDSREVMRIFCMDTSLNLSSTYLDPGFAFGGSCLPKDLKALNRRIKEAHVSAPVIGSILQSNEEHIRHAIRLIEGAWSKKVGILGLSFKAETDDLRGSPVVKIVERLVGKGYSISVYDGNLDLDRIMGTNREFLEQEVPYLPAIMRASMDDVVDESEVLVVANKSKEFKKVIAKLRSDQVLVDLVGIVNDESQIKGRYIGICW
jgi:GDP-mannose 6-dehydrogenase